MVPHFLRLIILFAFLLAAASEETRITFPEFSSKDDLMTYGDAAHNTATRSYIVNPRGTHSAGSCGELLYGEKFRFQDAATGRSASFNTSFSFKFTTHGSPWDYTTNPRDGSAFAFVFLKTIWAARMKGFKDTVGRTGACKSHRSDPVLSFTPSSFEVVIGTDYNPNHTMPSNNYIRVGKNLLEYEYDIPAYTHNLCGNDTHCSYFSNGKIFTAWIDFSSSAQTLEVWLANGSSPSVKKPLQSLLLIPNYNIPMALGDDVYLTFWGSSDINHVETHELLSWSFFSSGISKSNFLSSQTLLQSMKGRTWAGVTTGILAMASALLILWFIFRFARSSRFRRYSNLKYTVGPHVFSYAELRRATQNFDEKNLLGIGGSGSVYKGSLEGPSGSIFIAVKQIHFSKSKQAKALFHAEVSSLGQVRHRNVVQLYGWCEEKGRLLLVYEYMPNGGLNEWLHKSGDHFQHQQVLSLKMRHSIIEGVGAALEYLHEDCQSCILHRDIKSSNVLLDADLNAYLGDFGLARLMDHHKVDKTTMAAGTLGYMAPEIPYIGKATKESDVYSFGILVLEVMCGRRPIDMQAVEPEDLVLLYAVWRAREAGSLFNVVDPRLLQTRLQPSRSVVLEDDEYKYAIEPLALASDSHNLTKNHISFSMIGDLDVEVFKTMVVNLLHLGLLCCLPNPRVRPSMGQVNGILQQIRNLKNASTIPIIAMPSLPATKPLGLYRSLEFSKTTLSSSSYTPDFSTNVIDKVILEQAFDSLHKDD